MPWDHSRSAIGVIIASWDAGPPGWPLGEAVSQYDHHAVGITHAREHLCAAADPGYPVGPGRLGGGRPQGAGQDRPSSALVAEAETGSGPMRVPRLVPNVMTPIRCPPASPTSAKT